MTERYTVGFFIQTPFHYFLYESVIDNLVNMNIQCHLIINDILKNDDEWGNMYNRLIDFIEGIDRRDIDAFLISTVKESRFLYDCVVSAYFDPDIRSIGKKHIRLMYSLAKERWTYSWWNVFYDKILCYGVYDYKKLNLFNTCEIVGNPKFDKWFNDKLPDYVEIEELYDLSLDKNNKTILYVPTYGELSSISEWIEEIKNISNNLNVIIKMHHGTSYLKSEQSRRRFIERNFSNVLDDTADLLNLLKVTDYVVSDNSGVVFDAILAEKKIVLLNTKFNHSENYSSIESEIRKKIINIDSGTDILEILQDRDLWDSQIKKQHKIREELFSKIDGLSGERAAKEIIELANRKDNLENHFLLSLREKIFS